MTRKISRRRFVESAAAFAAVPLRQQMERRPNAVIILADDMGYGEPA